VATVSRVLKSRGYVAEETRARVAAVLRETSYRPNAMASGLRAQRSFSIGLIVPAITSNPFFVNVAHAVEEEALKHGYKTIIFNHNGSEVLERQGIERLLERRMDALLVCNATSGANVELALAAGVAVVQIERETSARTSAVVADNELGAREAMIHLIGLGHRRIAFIGGDPSLLPYHGPQPLSVEQQRLMAYREALAGAGIAERLDYIRLGHYYDISDGSGRYGREHMEALLGLDEPPTAVFATCDVLAAGALQALHSARIRVPDQMSLIGFDDTLAINLTPALTSVAQPMREMGAEAFHLAMAAIVGDKAPRTLTMPTWVIYRGSTAAAE
jgi:LacI family transcriptional regulator